MLYWLSALRAKSHAAGKWSKRDMSFGSLASDNPRDGRKMTVFCRGIVQPFSGGEVYASRLFWRTSDLIVYERCEIIVVLCHFGCLRCPRDD